MLDQTLTDMKNRITGVKAIVASLFLMVTLNAALAQRDPIQYFRYYDQRGVNVFEASKDDTVEFKGFALRLGAGFTQGYQNLNHENNAKAILPGAAGGGVAGIETSPGSNSFVNINTGAALTGTFQKDPNVYGGYINTTNNLTYTNSNAVYEMAGGFPLAQANFNIDVQIADGVSLNLVSYMSSHHHNEFWVKGGYFKVDKVTFLNSEFMNNLWKNLTLKVGHMEINYGDQHFRRTDGGHALWNPFIENYIMDEFTTEIGAELYWQKSDVIAMLGMTDGEIQGNVTRPNDRSPALYGKLGFDKNFGEDLRARLTGSFYRTNSSVNNTLFGGDRTGSNYQFVMEPTTATVTGNSFSGRFNPGFRDNLTTLMINPFVKFKGLEFFGTYEQAAGNTAVENGDIQYSNPSLPRFTSLDDRSAYNRAADLIYRFGKYEKFYVGARWNKVNAHIVQGQATTTGGSSPNINQGTRYPVSIERTSFAAGWFITRSIMLKAEYTSQTYDGFENIMYVGPIGHTNSSILSNGKFSGFVIQGAISF
jgi:hypothetical protein